MSSTLRTSGPYNGSFSGTLRDPASIASTTEVTGTMMLTEFIAGRGPTTCSGTSPFTGTANWTDMVMTAPRISLDCGVVLTNVAISLQRQQ